MESLTEKGIQGPKSICFQLLNRCNLQCPHCRAGASPIGPASLKLHQILRLIDNLTETGLQRVVLSGGEPTLWPELSSLVKELVDRELRFSITTNGLFSSLLFEKIPFKLWGNGYLRVSLDGSEELHDQLRGKGTFKRTFTFLQEARRTVPKLAVNTVLIWDPQKWSQKLHTLLVSIPIDQWAIISPVKEGRWKSELDSIISQSSYSEQFSYIENIVTKSDYAIPLVFWDYAKTENLSFNAIVIEANGKITLPGLYNSKEWGVKVTSIDAHDVVTQILQSTEKFRNTGHKCYF